MRAFNPHNSSTNISVTDESLWTKPSREGLTQLQRKSMKFTEHDYINAGYLFEKGRIKLRRFERMLAQEYQEHKNKAVFLFNRGRLEAKQ